MQTGINSYTDSRDRSEDPYQKVYNDIANDLKAHVQTLAPEEIRRIRQVSELRFFGDLAPTAYGDYLATDENGITSAVRLPARNDPMVDRLRRIRERDRLVIDTLNEHYANFYYGIAIPYESWRENAREQAIAYRQVRRSATMRALLGVVVVAGLLVVFVIIAILIVKSSPKQPKKKKQKTRMTPEVPKAPKAPKARKAPRVSS